jgi:hypothetical protein
MTFQGLPDTCVEGEETMIKGLFQKPTLLSLSKTCG